MAMTPEELKNKAHKVQVLQSEIDIINHKNAYIIIHSDDDRPFIRTQSTNPIYFDKHLEDLVKFIGETVRNKMVLDREQKIRDLCDG